MGLASHVVCCIGSTAAGGANQGGLSGLTMPFRGSDKVDPSGRTVSPANFSNSPVNGLLYVRGKIGECPLRSPAPRKAENGSQLN